MLAMSFSHVDRLSGIAAAMTLILFFSYAVPVAGQPTPPVNGESAEQNADSRAAAGTDSTAKDEQPPVLREQTVYIPYTKLRESFEKEGRGVFLPYEQFQSLWKAARAAKAHVPEQGPPVGAVITEIESDATIGENVITVDARLKIELLRDGWHEVAIRLGDAAIGKAEINGKPARLIGRGNYKLLLQKKKEDPNQLVLNLKYSKAFTKTPGRNSVAIQAPQAAVNRWKIRIAEAGVKVNVQPMIAASEVPEEDAAATETVVMAFLGAADSVRIDWTPKAEGALGLEALATVQAQQRITLDQGVVRTRTQLRYDITRADLSQLRVEVPADQKVAGVFDANVRKWDVQAEGDKQLIAVELFQPTRGRQNLTVDLEKFIGEFEKKQFVAPVVQCLDVGRQQGIVVLQLGSGLRAEDVTTSGLLQLDAAELPSELASSKWNFAYRYAALPFELKMDVEKIQPRVLVDQLVEAYFQPERLTLDLLAVYNVQKAGIFQLHVDVPKGYQVRQVSGRAAPGATPVSVDSHHVTGESETQLIVNLGRKALGRVGLFVELEKRLDDANLLSPTGQASALELPVPRVSPESVERSTGRLVVCKPESLRVNPAKQEGLRSISFKEAYQGVPTCRDGRFPKSQPALAFAFTDQAVSLQIQAERRKPYVTVKQLLTSEIKSGQIKYLARFNYAIRYSGVDSLRLDVPEGLVAKLNNTTPAIRESRIDPQPEDVSDGFVSLQLAGETELLGNVQVVFEWEETMSDLEVGRPVSIALPSLRPKNVDQAWGQILVAKSETIDVQPADAENLRPIDPRDNVAAADRMENAARAFEFHEDWQLSLKATRYQLEEVKRTSIEMGVVRQVVTRSGQISVQALYRMRSARQRIELALPAGQAVEFDSQPVRINGRAIPLERGDGDRFFIPLVGQEREDSFLLEIRYAIAGTADNIQVPAFPDEPAVQKVYLVTYVPEEQVLLGVNGPWTNQERPWWQQPGFRHHSSRKRLDQMIAGYLQSVSDAKGYHGNVGSSFATDGWPHIFSTLQPAAGDEGALRLVTMDGDWFQSLVFAVTIVIGVLLIRRKATDKVIALALLVIALILMGVFLPTLSGQVLYGVLFWAVCLVLLVWVVWFVIKDLPKITASLSAATPTASIGPSGNVTVHPPDGTSAAGESDAGDGESSKDIAEAETEVAPGSDSSNAKDEENQDDSLADDASSGDDDASEGGRSNG